ncbi:hypothetical protein BTN49_1128 [Candidatus Enterovibrio escicola]|uniref:Uncharacterized protein n=1 Tax=Candidatus Enterovibrio escicola TaxID=1927127 RepID=A0A2A5T4Q0_9GAMM|nr:hypothetical protein BTN49_1128 [Candidatus Enterovibrio escacola]
MTENGREFNHHARINHRSEKYLWFKQPIVIFKEMSLSA